MKSFELLCRLLVMGLLFGPTSACSSQIACADLGPDWTTCPPPNANVCVRKSKQDACNEVSGVGARCGIREAQCDGGCVSIDTDENCGACGVQCTAPERCFGGTCL